MKMLSLDDAIKAVTMLMDCETNIDMVWSDDVINNLQNAPSVTDVEPTQKWISVKDRLPMEGVTVLVWEKHGFAYVDQLENGIWQTAFVTHWHPLPEPPEEDAQQ